MFAAQQHGGMVITESCVPRNVGLGSVWATHLPEEQENGGFLHISGSQPFQMWGNI